MIGAVVAAGALFVPSLAIVRLVVDHCLGGAAITVRNGSGRPLVVAVEVASGGGGTTHGSRTLEPGEELTLRGVERDYELYLTKVQVDGRVVLEPRPYPSLEYRVPPEGRGLYVLDGASGGAWSRGAPERR